MKKEKEKLNGFCFEGWHESRFFRSDNSILHTFTLPAVTFDDSIEFWQQNDIQKLKMYNVIPSIIRFISFHSVLIFYLSAFTLTGQIIVYSSGIWLSSEMQYIKAVCIVKLFSHQLQANQWNSPLPGQLSGKSSNTGFILTLLKLRCLHTHCDWSCAFHVPFRKQAEFANRKLQIWDRYCSWWASIWLNAPKFNCFFFFVAVYFAFENPEWSSALNRCKWVSITCD